MKVNKIIFICIVFSGLNLFSQKNKITELKPKDIFIKELISKMTVDEKIGQLNLPSSGDITTGQAQSADIAKKIQEGSVGGLFNIKSVAKIKEVQKIAVEKSRLKIPLIFGMDVIHGYETTFPIPLGLSSSWDMKLIEQTARIAAIEATADGINWTFSPMVDISRDPRWGRVSEGNGEDPFLASQIAKSMVNGYQNNNLSATNSLMACVKHFALYGAPEGGRDYNTVDMSRIKMYNEYFPPYKAAVDAGAGSVMASFNEIDGIPATGNKWLLTEVLRNQWNFKGFLVTDYTGINEMIDHGMGDLKTVSTLALKAGIDMDMVGEGFQLTLKKALADGTVKMEEIDAACYRILEAKYDLGLFHNPYKNCDINQAKSAIFTPENRTFARKVAAESMVLLKNSKQILPLKKNSTFAVIGPLANTATNMAGTWSVATKQDKSITFIDGFKEVVGKNASVFYAKGSNLDYNPEFQAKGTMFGKEIPWDNRSKEMLLEEAIATTKNADVIIAVVGEGAEMSGESSSRTNLELPKAQKDLLLELKKTGKPIVLVLFTGRPLVLVDEDQNFDTILNVWFPGSEAGLAIADVLLGAVNPSGKLTATWPRNVGQIPIYYSHKNTGRPLNPEKTANCEFEKFKSNYLDVCNTPLYPFGYGLSYTKFDYSNIEISNTKLSKGEKIQVSVKITNSGNYDGKEIVQLYIRDVVGSVTRPVKELKGFQKIELAKGATKIVTFEISEEDLKFYNSDLNFVSEPGQFEVFVGPNSDTSNKILIELK
jgi:beta-glucosidase